MAYKNIKTKALYRRKYYARNAERLRAYGKRCYQKAKVRHANYQRTYRLQNHDQICARRAVHNAVKRGALSKPESCQECNETEKRIEAHHHKGYAKEFFLDVIWLCASCHRDKHFPIPS